MSGTSLDGLDVALCQINHDGVMTQVEIKRFATVSYDEHFKSEIRRVFAKKEIDLQHLTLLNEIVAERHAAIVNQCLHDWGIEPTEVDLIASHGQTVFHAPRVFHLMEEYPNATLQIGDGDHIARRTGIITVSDFRQKHIAAGGEGAPLALYGDYFLFSKANEDRFLLNIGGIANFTFLPGNQDSTLAFATDTGPGNTLSDAYAREQFGVDFDADARIALQGNVNEHLLTTLKQEAFFSKGFPKTIGPELFSYAWVIRAIQSLPKGNNNPFDVMATICRLSAETIADAVRQIPATCTNRTMYLSGGGAHNPLIVKFLKELLPEIPMFPMLDAGIHGDAKEAVLFAVLANELVAGDNHDNMILGGVPLVSMGKISVPD